MLHAGVQTYEVCLPESKGGGVAHSLTYRHSEIPQPACHSEWNEESQ